MSEEKAIRITKAAAEFNVSLDHIYETLAKNGITIEHKPTAKLTPEAYIALMKEYSSDRAAKADADQMIQQRQKRDNIVIDVHSKGDVKATKKEEDEEQTTADLEKELLKIKGTGDKAKHTKVAEIIPEIKEEVKAPEIIEEKKVEIETIVLPEPIVEEKTKPAKTTKEEPELIKAKADTIGIKVEGKIDLEDTKSKRGKKKKETEPTLPEVESAEEAEITKAKKKKKQDEEQQVIAQPVETPVEVTTSIPVTETTDDVESKIDEIEFHKVKVQQFKGPIILGKMELPVDLPKKKPVASSSASEENLDKRRKRKRKDKKPTSSGTGANPTGPFQRNKPDTAGKPGDNRPKPQQRPSHVPKAEPTEKEISEQIKQTLARLSGQGQKSKSSKMRKAKREQAQSNAEEQMMMDAEAKKKIKVTEFVSANDLARLMSISVTQVISTCMSLGMFVSINQRLDAETITVVADEFGFEVEFVSADVQESITEVQDKPEELLSRPPIVTVMGHVDHGKTSLLDYIRNANVIAGEAGGITQHIGAYEVTLENGQHITFLDTPGHEAFTAMRARGAKVTDVAIIVVSADDSVMPQTIEAINHAQAAGVPLVFAINKIDKAGANPERIREQLSKMNILVEEWGGKYQSQEISAKKGLNIDKLLDKVLIEAEMLELKANPNRNAKGTVIEASLDKGRGYVSTLLVQTGTIKVGDVVLAGCYSGRVKALFNERGQRLEKAGPSEPVIILGLTGAPQAGDQFNVMDDEREARDIANRRFQLQREQGIRAHKHITLDEIGRRLAIGNFKELNLIVKADVDGSVEALSDSLLKLGNAEIQVNVIHKSVGQISESDVLLASASEAIIIGFQVRPSMNARKLAENEQIDIRFYSVIYDAINEVKDAMEGMLAPEYEDKIVCNVEVRETFVIPRIGTIAGCMVLDGKITRNTKIRLVRDGIVIFSGELDSLKRFKDDVKDVASGYECGLSIKKFNDIQIGDIIEGYDLIAVKRTLS